MFDRIDDTIVAVSSSVGRSVRALIRLSGSDSTALASHVFTSADGRKIKDMPGQHRVRGRVMIGDGSLPAELYVFRAPASYTRQDIVELHLIGSPPVLDMLLEQLIRLGARMAEPGEFTGRAYLSGAIDLTKAEGVAAVIHARSDAQVRASEAMLHGRLSQRTIELRDRLADLLALLEAEIDFAEEPIDFISPHAVVQEVCDVQQAVDALLQHARSVERLAVLPEIMLVGRPNAGKSTLFNRLTGMERVIASATAGTTRDVISAPVALEGGEAMLLDSAGIADDAGDGALDTLARAATSRAMTSADLVVAVIDATETPLETLRALRDELADRLTLVVINKADACAEKAREICEIVNDYPCIAISAKSGTGIDRLRKVLSQQLFAETTLHGAETLALSNRQRSALREASEALQRVRDLMGEAQADLGNVELLALEAREAANALSLLTGELATEDLLGRIFEDFCIGK